MWLGNYSDPFPVFARLPSGANSLQRIHRGTMTTERSPGPEARATNPALTPQRELNLSLYREILRGLPLGIAILELENPLDAKTFRIIEINPTATLLTGATSEELSGRTLAEFPKLLKTRFPHACAEALESGEPRNGVWDTCHGMH